MQIDKKFWFNVVSVHLFYINSSAQHVIFHEWVFKCMLAFSWNCLWCILLCWWRRSRQNSAKTLHFSTSNSIWSATCWFLSEWNFAFSRNSFLRWKEFSVILLVCILWVFSNHVEFLFIPFPNFLQFITGCSKWRYTGKCEPAASWGQEVERAAC